MPNNYFSFKQFTIHQDHCAMKVCTDACLFGAWVANKIEGQNSTKDILDIGAGTGLLSLMLAQKNNAFIDAVELDEAAAAQASENFNASPWKERLQVFHLGIEEFDNGKKYDLITSNPPFFEDDLKSINEQRNAAMHSTTLNLEKLLVQIESLLKKGGKASVLIPYHRSNYFEKLLTANGFFVQKVMHVKQSVTHDFFRSMYYFSKEQCEQEVKELSIQNAEREYTNEFIELLKDYYLKL